MVNGMKVMRKENKYSIWVIGKEASIRDEETGYPCAAYILLDE